MCVKLTKINYARKRAANSLLQDGTGKLIPAVKSDIAGIHAGFRYHDRQSGR